MAAKEYLDINGLKHYNDKIQTIISAGDTAVNAIATDAQSKANTLIGSDTGKSARTIANEELAAQLIPANAKEALDTLTEIASWIQKHPDDVATMNQNIQDNATAIGDASSGLTKKVADLETAVGEGGSVSTQINSAITSLGGSASNTGANDLVTVTVSTSGGQVSGVTLTQTKLSTAISTAQTNATNSSNGYTDSKIGEFKTIVDSEIYDLFGLDSSGNPKTTTT